MSLKRKLILSALCLIAAPFPLYAQVDIENGVPVTIPVDAEMDNNFSVDVTDIDFGVIAATNAIGETAELTITPGGSLDETTGNTGARARLVSNGGGRPGTLDIESALADQTITIRYGNITNLTCGTCAGTPPVLVVSRIADDAALQNGGWSADSGSSDGDAVPGRIQTGNDGAARINIGVTLRTDGSGTAYPSGTYVGSLEVTLEY